MAAAFFCLCLDKAMGPPDTAATSAEVLAETLEDMLANALTAGANFAAGNNV